VVALIKEQTTMKEILLSLAKMDVILVLALLAKLLVRITLVVALIKDLHTMRRLYPL